MNDQEISREIKLVAIHKFLIELEDKIDDLCPELSNPETVHIGFYNLGCVSSAITNFIEKVFPEKKDNANS